MRLALLQADIACAEPEKNLTRLTKMIENCMREKPDVVILPEMWNTSYALQKVRCLADRSGIPCAKAIGELAAHYAVNIVAGSVADVRDEKVYNTSYVFNRQGELVSRYSKIHLFSLMKEREYLTAGDARTVFLLDGVKCGLIICYDLRFPELARALALDGATVLFVPAQWPHPRLHPWKTLLQARAIENQMYTVGVNRVGLEGKAVFFGNSMVVDPLGEALVQGTEEEGIIFAELDFNKVTRVREHMTCFNDRLPDAYK